MEKECHMMTSQICLAEVSQLLAASVICASKCLDISVVIFCWLELETSITVSLSIHAVLSGTKYGLKQTRGKFGLGAKMVMIDNMH